MHAVTVRLLRLSYGETQAVFSRRVRRHEDTVSRWEAATLAPDRESEGRLSALAAGKRVRLSMLDAILAVLLLAEKGDRDTCAHALRVSRLAEVIARRMGSREVAEIATAGMLHDIGKVLVPSKIMEFPGRLAPDEMLLIQQHAAFPAALIECVAGPAVARAAAQHHERTDGSGYPAGLRGGKISLGGRIIGAVDEWDARTSKREYRTKEEQEKETTAAVLQNMEERHKGTHDAAVVRCLRGVLRDEARRSKRADRWAAA